MVMHVCPNPTTTAGPSLFLRPRSSCGPMSLCSASTNGRTSLTGPPPDGISSPWRGGAGMGSRWRGRLSPGRSPWKPASRTHVRLPRAGPPIGSCWLLTTSVAPGARAAPLLAPQAEAPRPPPVLWGGVDYFSRWAGGGGVLPSAGRACARHVTRSIALSCRARLRGYNGPPLNLPTFGGTGPDAGGPTWWGNPENPFRKCGCWAMLLPHVYECSSCCRRSLHAGNLVAEAHTLKNPNEL